MRKIVSCIPLIIDNNVSIRHKIERVTLGLSNHFDGNTDKRSNKYPILVALFFLFSTSYSHGSNKTHAQAEVFSHVEQLMSIAPNFVGKWSSKITYLVAGTDDQRVQSAASEMMKYLSGLTDIKVEKAKKNEPANFIFVLTTSIGGSAKSKDIENLFIENGETRDNFVRRMQRADKTNSSIRKMNYKADGSIHSVNIIDNPRREKTPLNNYFLYSFINGFFNSLTSKEIVPSIHNGSLPNSGYFEKDVTNLPRIDELFLKAIYRKSVKPSDDKKKILQDTVKFITEELKK